jgi:hypothetical protein
MLGLATGARPFGLIEEAGGRIDHSDSQTFALSLSYTNSLQFTTLYTLPHGLPRHAESTHGLRYRHVVRRCSVHQQLAYVFRDPNTPRCAWRQLFAGNESRVQPAMECRSCYAEDFGSLLNGQYLSTFGLVGLPLAPFLFASPTRFSSSVRKPG